MSFLIRRGVLSALGGGLNVADVFSNTLYAGTGSSLDVVTGFDFTVDDGLIWLKDRTQANANNLFDTLRGANNHLFSDSNNAEGTSAIRLTSFNNDGFTVAPGGGLNKLGNDFVSWSFRKAPKFFDVIKYTGDGVPGREIPHALGVQAGMVTTKSTSNSSNWRVQHVSQGGTMVGTLSANVPFSPNISMWNDTDMTDAAITLGTAQGTNQSGLEYIMYVFAHDPGGVIQCGEYIGNGSTTGPIVTLGWKPQFLLIKTAIGGNGSWFMLDTARGIITNGSDNYLNADKTNAELSVEIVNLLTDGFQLKIGSGALNTLGNTYIYMAIKEG